MSKLNIFLDLDNFDKIELTTEKRNEYINNLDLLCKEAERLHKEGKLSKIMLNRIKRLWLFLPREEGVRTFLKTKEFHSFFDIKPLDLIKLKVALKKIGALK